MKVQVYAENELIYDPNLNGYELLGLQATVGVNKAGTAEIVLPASHFAYNSFVSQKTVVTIYLDGALLFRGRVLYQTDDWDRNRTLTCEGERCFFCDSVLEAYLYQTSPRVIFSDIIRRHNAQVDTFKQFQIGAVTAEDPNDYIRLESESAEQISDVLDKLVERVGGYITFTTDSAGRRTINWLASLDRESGQTIEFGENLLDYSATGANTELATVIYPYGAKDETTGERVTIENVNNGLRYIQDDEAVAIRGRIAKIFTWDDVTLAHNLLTKAQQQLAESKMLVTTLEVSAVDLSVMDKSIDALRVGDTVRVKSTPHGVNDLFQLTERTYNLLDPSQDKIVLGKDRTALTTADVQGDKRVLEQIKSVEKSLKTDYTLAIIDEVAAVARTASGGSASTSAARNLLDNSDFANAVNQRGESIYSTSGKYTFDRWLMAADVGGMVNVGDGYIALYASSGYVDIEQIFERADRMTGKAYTLAVMANGANEPYLLNFTFGTYASVSFADGQIILYHYNSDRVIIRVANAGASWVGFTWAALYEGTYTADTLPEYIPKGYAAERAECLRYYEALYGAFVVMSNGKTLTSVQGYSPKRIAPTVSISTGDTITMNRPGIGTATVTVTSVQAEKQYFDHLSISETLTAGDVCIFHYSVSADL